jgi:sigma-B regulation protein RsbU (phosphoserine phosphatase)
MTMSLIRYHDDGRLIVAGAHQSIVIWRAATGKCDRYLPQGTWLGLVENILPFTRDREYRLEAGDLLILYTDGLTEAMNEQAEQFGLERVCEGVERAHAGSAEDVRDELMRGLAEWSKEPPRDDTTLLVLKQVGVAQAPRLAAG